MQTQEYSKQLFDLQYALLVKKIAAYDSSCCMDFTATGLSVSNLPTNDGDCGKFLNI